MTTNGPRLPPGQQLVAERKWPLVGERHSRATSEPWSVAIAGAVRQPRTYSLDELRALPQAERTVDIHCVTRWSKPGVRFSGVLLADVLQAGGAEPAARFVSFVARSDRAHSTSLALADALGLDVYICGARKDNRAWD